jgi:pimeloyl-ACP methyl ester carboxylesterase
VGVTSVQLAEGREANVVRLGSPGGWPVLYFHSPASSGEELDGAAEDAARELGIELVTIVRRSLAAHDSGSSFMATVASAADLLVTALGLKSVAVLGWSGGAPYALAASERLGPVVRAVHLVSPVPGPLIGPDAVPHQSERLQQIATTSPTSSWVVAPGALRDYMAVVAPWSFDVHSVVQPVTIWAPTEDDIVPPRLIEHLARQLSHAQTINVPGSHDWITENWATVLRRIATP